VTEAHRRRIPTRPKASSFGLLRHVAERFRPTYRIDEESAGRLRIVLQDPSGERPNVVLRHSQARRLFFRANYLVIQSHVPGRGPTRDGELRFRFRGPMSRRRASLRWRNPVPDGQRWVERLDGPLHEGLQRVEAVESFNVRWNARRRIWHMELRTLSGSMVGGFMTAMPIAVPFDPEEAAGVVALIDGLAGTGHTSAGGGRPDPPPEHGDQ
jgi:hypothetical protein